MRRFLITLALLAEAVIAASPQQAGQTPTFRSRVDAVTVDVNVTDNQGRPVIDLTAADFEIKENGSLQSITSFRRFAINHNPTDASPAPITSLDTQEREAARDDVRLIAVFLDDYHTRLSNAMAVREKLATFISQLDPRDMVALMYPLTPSTLLTFSRDHEGTARAVRKFEGRKYNYTPRYPEEDVYGRLTPQQIENLRDQIVIDAVAGMSTVLGSFHDRRKTIVMVSEGMASFLPATIGRRASGGAAPVSAASSTPPGGLNPGSFSRFIDLQNRIRDILTAAARSNTSVYTWDPRGLAASEFDASDAGVDRETDRRYLQETIDSLRVIAEETGGRAIVDSNDPYPLLHQILADTSAYYLLGYNSTEAPRDGKFHEITVRVKRKGVDVRARKGYWALSPDDVARADKPGAAPLPVEMADALTSVATPAAGRLIRTWIGSARADSGGQSSVTVVWEVSPDTSAAASFHHVNVIVSSANGDPVLRGKSVKDASTSIPSGRLTFMTRPGTIHVRASAEDAAGQSLDLEERDVQVPDFTAVRLMLTVPEIYRARTARELAQVRDSVTALPTATHHFMRTDQLLVRFRVYSLGGTRPTIVVTLRNSIGEALSTLPAPQQRPDGQLELALVPAGLAAGTYIMDIEAALAEDKARVFWGFAIK